MIIRCLTKEEDDGKTLSVFVHSESKEERKTLEEIVNTLRASLAKSLDRNIPPLIGENYADDKKQKGYKRKASRRRQKTDSE